MYQYAEVYINGCIDLWCIANINALIYMTKVSILADKFIIHMIE